MKILSRLGAILLVATTFVSCSKDDSDSSAFKETAEEFKAFIQSKNFQIADYYSDKPIDYVEDDNEVKAETDLWEYVSPWLKDDFNVFDISTGKVTIQQNAIKIEGIPGETIIKDFSVTYDKKDAYLNFLNYEYLPLKYHLVEFSDNHFIVYADWHSGAKVYTRFEVVAP